MSSEGEGVAPRSGLAPELQTTTPLPDGLLCPDCAYDLRALTSDRCPECGFELAPLRRQESLLPWRRRRQIGRLRAFWKTFWVICTRPKRLAIEISIDQPASDARRFWLVTYLHLLPFVLGAVLAPLRLSGMPVAQPQREISQWVVGSLLFTAAVWLWLLPELATYMLQSHAVPEDHEQRSRTLSIYTWGILLWVIPAATAWILAFAIGLRGREPGLGFLLTAVCLAVLPVVFMQRRLYVICRSLLHSGRVLSLVRIVAFNIAALALFGLLLILPAGVLFLSVAVRSLLD
jgi:hypothetical protein